MREVSKGMERDDLALVLVWTGCEPPELASALLPLALSCRVPSLGLPAMAARFGPLSGIVRLLVLASGFEGL